MIWYVQRGGVGDLGGGREAAKRGKNKGEKGLVCCGWERERSVNKCEK